MREIKFRGRRMDDTVHNGRWVYGYYFEPPLTDENSGSPAEAGWYFLSDGEPHHCIEQDGVVFTVEPETVGEYTGLKDKNGVEIYEGDICRNPSGEVGVIMYGNGMFVSRFVPPFDWDPMAPCDGRIDHQEVIGNIYENPDLLEGAI